MKRSHLRAVTGARFFAAIAVLAFHFSANNSANLPWFISRVIQRGGTAVNFFFVLSGFVLAYNYLDRIIEPREFWLSRFARIYPLYLLALVINLPFFIGTFQSWSYESVFSLIGRFLIEFSLLQSWIPLKGDGVNGPGWSIATEALFYCIFPIVATYLSKCNKRQTIMFVVTTFTIAIIVQIPLLFLRWGIKDDRVVFENFMAYFPLLHLPGFLIGAGAGKMFLENWIFNVEGLSLIKKTVFDVAIIALCGFIIIINPFYSLVNQAFIAPLLALLILSLACGGSIVTKFLALSPVVLLGEISYAIYIIQIPVSNYFKLSLNLLNIHPNGFVYYSTLYITVILSVSFASYYLLERPARKKILQFYNQRKKVFPSIALAILPHQEM